MPLTAGTRLGPYEIVSPLGAGGMGEVYKATDSRLSRSVAIKILPPQWVADAEMRQRFEREAQTIASLNHPNICVLHDIGFGDGIDFLVMEFLDGETLSERLKRGPLPLDESLDIAIAVSDALDKAHRQNVVHRDLKPSNVMLTESGPKLLDFGLAKTGAVAAPASGKSGLTMPGTLVGTLQYMAPEQLEGAEADARTDIFALGVLLHEMITGKKVFEGKSRVLLMSAIATAEVPPISTIEPNATPALDHVVRTCLAKDPADRWQTARDLQEELRAIAVGADEGFVGASRAGAGGRSRRLARIGAMTALVAGVALVVPGYLHLRGAEPADEVRFRVPLQLSADSTALPILPVAAFAALRPAAVTVSPDGRWMTFSVSDGPGQPYRLYMRPLGGVAPQLFPATEDAGQTFWSPDSRTIAFAIGGRLKKVDATGGQPEDLCAVTDLHGGTWNQDGVIVLGSTRGLLTVPAQGGKPEPLTTLEGSESGHFWPQFLPDGRRYLFSTWGESAARAIYVGALGSKDRTKLMAAESNAEFVTGPDGRGFLVFHRDKAVYAQPFDPDTLALSGEPTRVADDVSFDPSNGRGYFATSRGGALAYFQNTGLATSGGAQSETGDWHLAWSSRVGQVIDTPGPPGNYRGVELGPDDKRIAVHKHEPNGGDVWIFEPTGAETRITWDASQHNASPIWAPDGKSVVYSSTRNGKVGLYRKPADGSGVDELLYESQAPKAPLSWSPDSKYIVFGVQDPKTGPDLWLLTLADKKAAPFIATPYAETRAQISPDGRWIAYTSDSVGNRREIHVQSFPSGAGHWQVSTAGGDWPRWRKDGKELFYHSLGPTNTPSVTVNLSVFGPVYSTSVDGTGTAFVSSPPSDVVVLRALNFPHGGLEYNSFAVSSDGQRFLYLQVMPATGGGTAAGPDPSSGLVVALNWTSRVK